MVRTRINVLGGCLAALLLVTAPASAQMPILTYGFTDTSAAFTLNPDMVSGTYSAVADSDTDGDVTRPLPVSDTAYFEQDFTGGMADFVLSMAITGIGAGTANGSGSFTITDVDGDTITGNISGTWNQLAGIFASFEGALSNVTVTSNDGMIHGTTGSFAADLSDVGGPAPYPGAIVLLMLPGNWFTANFSNANTLVQGAVVPEPATIALVVLGGLAAIRRRAA